MSSHTYRADIDGLRAVAVLSVVANHISEDHVPGGYAGVDVFFVISGYLITKNICSDLAAGRFSFAAFYERRIRRLFPALFAMIAAAQTAGYFCLLPTDYTATMRASLATLAFSSNVLFWKDQGLGYFAPAADFSTLLHTWSLGVEEQFYLGYPIALICLQRYFPAKTWPVLAGLAAVSLVTASVLVIEHPVPVFFLSPFRAWEMLAGALLASGRLPALASPRNREGVGILSLIGLGATFLVYDARTTFPGATALLPVMAAAGLIHAGNSGSSWASRLLGTRPLVYVGLISYSLYLWHWPLVVFARFATYPTPPSPLTKVVLFGASLAAGAASYHAIEKPFRSHRAHRSRVLGSAASVAAILGSIALAGICFAGFPRRVSPDARRFDEARHPHVPFIECDQHFDSPCEIGAPSEAESTVVLWGDSHLIAWAPVFDQMLRRRGERAIFMATSACPPLLGVSSTRSPRCARANDALHELLATRTDIHTVVMVAYWGLYFDGRMPLVSTARAPARQTPREFARDRLLATTTWLEQQSRQAVIVAPVPTYPGNVPLSLALAAQTNGRRVDRTTLVQHHSANADFFGAVEHNRHPLVHLIDPSRWLCTPVCTVERNGVAYYRDESHLSVAGATAYLEDLERAYAAAVGPPR